MNNKTSKILTIALIVVILGIIAVLAYVGYTAFAENKTKETYTEAAKDFELKGGSGGSSSGSMSANQINAINVTTDNEKQLEGYTIIGTIEIPKVDLHCPILGECNKRTLEIAVSQIFSTSELNQPGNTVLYGHNYRNKLFFSRNDELQNGDTIYITDMARNKKKYEVYDKFETSSSDSTFYTRDTDGKCEITLSTCTDDASTTDRRLIILAKEAE